MHYSTRLYIHLCYSGILIYDLLYFIKNCIGVPVLLNTSFKVRDDNIVRTPSAPLPEFLNTGMSFLVIGPYLLNKLNPVMLCKDRKTR
ncbi:MAG TPA: hypothetical protein EYQ84_01740 [Nitrospinaceae bacterium]|nr:hypothetical protein [Nitrospinaceae bacterium]